MNILAMNKVDYKHLHNFEQLLDNIYEKLKHLSNITNCLAQNLVPQKQQNIFEMSMDPSEKSQMVQKLHNISRDAEIVNNWIHTTKISVPPISSQMYKDENRSSQQHTPTRSISPPKKNISPNYQERAIGI